MTLFAKYLIAALQALGINAVPVVGMFAADWSVETAMLLYLLENLIGIPLAALLVRLLAPPREDAPGMRVRLRREILNTYLIVALGFSLGSAVFILLVTYRTTNGQLDLTGLRTGLSAIALFAFLGFLIDLVYMRPLSLPRAEKVLERSLGRIFLLYLAVFVGMFLAIFGLASFFIPFVVLKTLVDIGYLLQAFPGRQRAEETAPTDDADAPPSFWRSVAISWKRRPR
jgi:hypothetical protein